LPGQETVNLELTPIAASGTFGVVTLNHHLRALLPVRGVSILMAYNENPNLGIPEGFREVLFRAPMKGVGHFNSALRHSRTSGPGMAVSCPDSISASRRAARASKAGRLDDDEV
jgi:hypothetical protein